jgi:MFS family permease
MKVFTKTIILLSLVSMFTDISSEMLYPVMPMFLKSIGFSVIWIGILEGIAEATAGFSKGYFGKLSDLTGKRVLFVRLGYGLSSLAKPAMALIAHPLWVLFSRTVDRLGKGIRTSARDAILSSESSPENKGKVFGLHRAADTLGAAIGPALALLYLLFFPGNYIHLFYIAFIPAIVGVALTFILKDNPVVNESRKITAGFFSFLGYWKTATRNYKRLIIGLLIFVLINSSDIFLLLILKHKGFADTWVIGAYIFYNLIYALASTPLGYIGDKIGLKKTFIFGLICFTLVYIGFGFASTIEQFLTLFFIYGIYAAATEGISKAWISNIAKKEETATAIGFYNSFQSVGTLISSVTAGLLWQYISPASPFLVSGLISILIVVYFIGFVRAEK